jgi:meso-butanediol dehydrogenase / (S,S)-butanediol dehydrogenase / diacetyl reductase
VTERMSRFVGKVVVITGAGGPGSGGAASRRFASEGATVVASDIDEHGLEQLIADAEVDHGGTIVGRRSDVMDADDVQALVDYAVDTFGKLDVMINHAARMNPPAGPFVPDIDPGAWRDAIDGVLNVVFYGCRAAIPHLLTTKGCVVNTASISGMGGDYAIPAYDAGKAGVINLTKAMAHDHGEQGVRFNCVSPGGIAYPSGNPMASMEEQYLERVPLRRFASPDDIAAAMAFLASEDASYITGHNLVVDGGLTSTSGQYPVIRHLMAHGSRQDG